MAVRLWGEAGQAFLLKALLSIALSVKVLLLRVAAVGGDGIAFFTLLGVGLGSHSVSGLVEVGVLCHVVVSETGGVLFP